MVPEIVSVCTADCPNTIRIEVRVWNQGTEPVMPGVGIVVRAGASGPVIASAIVPEMIPSGRSSSGIALEIPAEGIGMFPPVVEVDRNVALGQSLTECDEDNNRAMLLETCG